MNNSSQPFEYLAGGKVVSLQLDQDYVGVRTHRLDEELRQKFESSLKLRMQSVGNGLILINSQEMPAELATQLSEAQALVPVFRDAETQVIPLPEVRIEPPAGKAGSSRGMKSVHRWVDKHEARAKILTDQPDRLVLAPRSGYGPDAMTLAGDIARKFSSITATPRFVRVTRRI